MEPNDRKLFAQIVGQILIADGALADAEREYLDRVMNSLEMSPEEQKAALSGIDTDSPVEERVKSLSSDAQQKLLDEVGKAVNSDAEAGRGGQLVAERIRSIIG